MDKIYDVVVIGAGPAGEVGAIRAAQLGLKVALVEKNQHLGGTCLNVGCIPTKSLIESAKTWDKLQHVTKLGFKAEGIGFDWGAILERKDSIVDAQRKGLRFLMKKNGIDCFEGHGRFVDKTHLEVAGPKERVKLRGNNFLIATGSRVKHLPGIHVNGKTIQCSDDILFMKTIPKTLAVIGGGVVGMEFASLFGRFGSLVTVIELMPQIIPTEDPDCAAELVKQLRKQNVTVETNTKLIGIEDLGTKCRVKVEKKESREFDVALVSVGREPVTDDLGLDKIGLTTDRGYITVDAHYRTTISNVFAVGDVLKTPALAHTASAEAYHAVEVIAGKTPPLINYEANPSAIYTYPEVASIGLTEPALKAQHIPYKVANFPFAPLAKAKIEEAREGFIKILFGAKHGELLGVHIIGAKATELISEFVLGKVLETTVEEIAHAIHPHPTISETVMEAAHMAVGGAIHL